jgi:citrate/tricarballylate utilization protein
MDEVNLFEEANRQLTICNACRYCEGFCPVFKAVEARRTFTPGDIRYFANLCHDCRACYQACMFTPPHEFAINFPKLMSDVRIESYKHWSWPAAFGKSFTSKSVGVFIGLITIAVTLIVAFMTIPPERIFGSHLGPGAFYEIVPYATMVIPAIVLFAYGIMIWLQGSIRFWNEGDSPLLKKPATAGAVVRAISDALSLRYLGGGGPGCSYPEEKPSSARRVFHSLVFWGFLLDFASTTLAFVYEDFFHRLPPYPILSAPVLFGTVGGVGLIIGTAGLLWFKMESDRSLSAETAYSMDYAFLFFLGLVALTGMFTLALRDTTALGTTLLIHLASVAALFITAPYGKFVHVVYRTFALIRYQIEQEHPAQGGGH